MITSLWLYYTTTYFDLDRSSLGGFKINKYEVTELRVNVKTSFYTMDLFLGSR